MKGLREDGLAIPTENPSAIAADDVKAASVIFAIGCTLPKQATASGKTDSWEDVPGDKGYGAMRDAIVKHVERLVDDLLKKQRAQGKNQLSAVSASPGAARSAGRFSPA